MIALLFQSEFRREHTQGNCADASQPVGCISDFRGPPRMISVTHGAVAPADALWNRITAERVWSRSMPYDANKAKLR